MRKTTLQPGASGKSENSHPSGAAAAGKGSKAFVTCFPTPRPPGACLTGALVITLRAPAAQSPHIVFYKHFVMSRLSSYSLLFVHFWTSPAGFREEDLRANGQLTFDLFTTRLLRHRDVRVSSDGALCLNFAFGLPFPSLFHCPPTPGGPRPLAKGVQLGGKRAFPLPRLVFLITRAMEWSGSATDRPALDLR